MTSSKPEARGNRVIPRARGFCAGIFNIDQETMLTTLKSIETQLDWGISGEEICPTTGNLHFQTALYFKSKKSMKQVCDCFPVPTFWEVIKGKKIHNKIYCSEDEKVIWS